MKFWIYIVGIVICFPLTGFSQDIRINEASASNSIIEDEDGDKSDWLEIYNYGSDNINLEGWALSDDADQLDKWIFPPFLIEENDYLLLWASGKDRFQTQIASAITYEGDEVKYIVPNNQTSTLWRNKDFDDTSWLNGITGIGYGDQDDNSVLTNGTRSVFIRKHFDIQDVSNISSLILDMDYDDGFVAYINGIEIARSNNMTGDFPGYNAFATAVHEAVLYSGGTPSRYDVSDDIDSILENGENVLAIQVHNFSSTSSDFTSIPFLTIFSNEIQGPPPSSLLGFSDKVPHTNFKISSAGETIYLTDPTGLLYDSLVIDNVETDITIGIDSNGDRAYFEIPTPGEANGVSSLGITNEEIVFSQEGGPTSSFDLLLSTAATQSIIRYTTDATVPTTASAIFNNPISISENTVVRARLFRQNYIPGRTSTHTYIIDPQHDLPIVTLVADPDDLFDTNTGIYELGTSHQNSFPFFGANFWQDWERPAHFSLFENGGDAYSLDLGIKIFGGWSRANNQRSFSLFARKQYGAGNIEHPMFEELPYQKFESLVLRNAGNDWLRSNMRDIISTSLMDNSGVDHQAYKSVVAYVNEEYWGIYNLREKVSKHFLASKHGIDADEIDLLEFSGDIVEGNNQDYYDLISFTTTSNPALDENYNYLKSQIDIDNYIKYQAAQIYFDNKDWPGNNIKFWKHAKGKWRWILFDTDFGFAMQNAGDHNFNTLSFALSPNGPDWPNPPWSTLLFRNLIRNIDFRNSFINQLADELNSRFLPDNVKEHIDEVSRSLTKDMGSHYSRWGANLATWNAQTSVLKTFATQRPLALRNHVKNYFNLPKHSAIEINNATPNRGFVQVNSLKIQETFWSGRYFENVPITLIAVPEVGFAFSHWEGDLDGTIPNRKINVDKTMNFTAVFVETSEIQNIVINEINYKSSDLFDTGDWIEFHNPTSQNIDLTGWTLEDGDGNVYSFPSNQLLTKNGYLVIAEDLVALQLHHPKRTNLIGNLNFGLSSEGEGLNLRNANGVQIDTLHYLPLSPWPENANGTGASIELIDPLLENALGENWDILHTNGSPGWDNRNISSVVIVKQEDDILSYPNPTRHTLFIKLPTMDEYQKSEIRLFDLNGHSIFATSEKIEDNGLISIPVDHMLPGAYLVKVRTEQSEWTTRFIKI